MTQPVDKMTSRWNKYLMKQPVDKMSQHKNLGQILSKEISNPLLPFLKKQDRAAISRDHLNTRGMSIPGTGI